MANPNPPNQFQPGQSGNPNGRPKKGESLSEMMRGMLQKAPKGQKMTYGKALVRSVYKRALEGDATAVKLIFNYIEGLPQQSVDLTSKGQQLNVGVVSYAEEPTEEEEANG